MTDEDDEELVYRSRGDLSRQRKAEEDRLAALATALAKLSKKQLAKLTLEEEVVDAVCEARRMTTHSARARQLRLVRRELRGVDSVAIAAAVDDLLNPSGRPSPLQRSAAAWTERLVAEGPDVVEELLALCPTADRQRLHTLLRNLHKSDAKKLTKARKALDSALVEMLRDMPPSEATSTTRITPPE